MNPDVVPAGLPDDAWEQFKLEASGGRRAWDIDCANATAFHAEFQRLLDSGDDGRWLVLDECWWKARDALRAAGVDDRAPARISGLAWVLYGQTRAPKMVGG